MPRSSFAGMRCPIARTLDVVGDWWTLLVLRDVHLGLTRFDAIQEDLGVSRKVLAQRLAALVQDGVLEREAYQHNPPRYDYRLTRKGRELAPVLLALKDWGERWTEAPAGADLSPPGAPPSSATAPARTPPAAAR